MSELKPGDGVAVDSLEGFSMVHTGDAPFAAEGLPAEFATQPVEAP